MPRTLQVNRNVLEMEYAVRGPIPQRAAAMQREGRMIIPCNIGNPQALGQQPLRHYREVLTLLERPGEIARQRKLNAARTAHAAAFADFADDDFIDEATLTIAEALLAGLKTGTGAYTDSQGARFVREAIARFIDERDGVTEKSGKRAIPDQIFLTNGASEGAKNALSLLIAKPNDGVMIPIPQYPLYSAVIRECGGVQVNYYPDEDRDWALDRTMLESAFQAATHDGVNVKAIVVINPGNPTGAVLPPDGVREVVQFAIDYGLAIIADEVYQENLYGAEWISCAKALGDADLPLFSLHSTSKGYYGECGHRGGYMELRNPTAIDGSELDLTQVLFKQASVRLCCNTVGQALTYLLVTPPPAGSAARKLFDRERDQVLSDLQRKGEMIRAAFQDMAGVQCFGRIGAMYLFPRLEQLPAGKTDFDYCMALLEETGLCTVNGSGFGQRKGTHHLRIAFLPPVEMLERVLPEWIAFHNRYVGA